MSDVRYPRFFDSPIEEMFAGALVVEAEDRRLLPKLGKRRVAEGQPILELHPQFQFEDWRVDLLVLLRTSPTRCISAIVECDGHKFHERTKEQALRDRSRDRDAQAIGCLIYRFTGTEIVADCHACANELLDVLMERGELH